LFSEISTNPRGAPGGRVIVRVKTGVASALVELLSWTSILDGPWDPTSVLARLLASFLGATKTWRPDPPRSSALN